MTYVEPYGLLWTESKLEWRCPGSQGFAHVHPVYQETTEGRGLGAETNPAKVVPSGCYCSFWKAHLFSSLQLPTHQATSSPFRLERRKLWLPTVMLSKLPGVIQVWLMSPVCSSCAWGRPPSGSHNTAHRGPRSSQGQTLGGSLVWTSGNPLLQEGAEDRML